MQPMVRPVSVEACCISLVSSGNPTLRAKSCQMAANDREFDENDLDEEEDEDFNPESDGL